MTAATVSRRADVPPASDADPVVALLRELVSEARAHRAILECICRLLEQQQRPSHLTRADRARLAMMLPAISGVFGSDPFVVRDLFESEAPAIPLVLRGLNARQVGRLFRRGEGHPIDAHLIQRDGVELHVTRWLIVGVAAVPEVSEVSNLPVPPRPARGLLK